MRTHFEECRDWPIVRDGIGRTISAVRQRWRGYGSQDYYNGLCLTVVWELLEKKKEFADEEDLGYYLFGNRFQRNRTFWEVDAIIREDCGIKKFDGTNKVVGIEDLQNILCDRGEERSELITKIHGLFNEGHLTEQEQQILTLFFDLSALEECRDDNDHTSWNVKEIAVAFKLKQSEVIAIKKAALLKLEPLLVEYS